MKFPWQPKPKSMSTMMINSMKESMINAMQTQVSSMFDFPGILGFGKTSEAFTMIFNGQKKVPLRKPDRKEEEGEQTSIYSEVMGAVNGDRDVVHRIPEEIDISAFVNDAVDPELRESIYDCIDAINEANEINRTGAYRTKESVQKANEESQARGQTNNMSSWSDVLSMVTNAIQPLLVMCINFCMSLVAILLMTKFAAAIEKI